MPHGGDLAEASLKGPLTSMIYTYLIGVGAAKESNFLTMDGVKHVVETLPNQDENSRRKLSSLLQDHLLDQGKSKACFQPIPEEQCIHIEADEDEVLIESSGGVAQETALIPCKRLYETNQFNFFQLGWKYRLRSQYNRKAEETVGLKGTSASSGRIDSDGEDESAILDALSILEYLEAYGDIVSTGTIISISDPLV